ncbi:pyruvate decarboxylase 2-like [Triticum aestivum]|uniref:pyruvate decarboxylase 2-like n=1 Tax=Triticum aestivum TaxID=4565 RepID=UPI001D0271FC|nr:pyruvate decarboxylase 2-like [Triticum aestivum]
MSFDGRREELTSSRRVAAKDVPGDIDAFRRAAKNTIDAFAWAEVIVSERINKRYECQLQYGSIGWSVGATLGYAQAAKDKRVISLIGDGSFQVTSQEVSTMLRWGQNNIIFLINNGGYTIEVKIHDGPYNVIKNWNYTGLVKAFHNGEGKCCTAKVQTEEELEEAIEASLGPHKDSQCFIEVIVHKDDTSKELLVWGARLFAANNRPPNPQ